MIVEHEVIEQVEEESNGRLLPWVYDLLRPLGYVEPMNPALREPSDDVRRISSEGRVNCAIEQR